MHFAPLILAALVTVAPGETPSGAAAGEVVAVRLASPTSTAIELKTVETFTQFTNVCADIVTYETAYALTYTNFDGEAAIETNVLRFVDYDYFKTNGVSKIIAGPVRFDLPVTNSVAVGEAPGKTVTVTNSILSETVEGIETFAITNFWWFGGSWLLTPDDAAIQADILIK